MSQMNIGTSQVNKRAACPSNLVLKQAAVDRGDVRSGEEHEVKCETSSVRTMIVGIDIIEGCKPRWIDLQNARNTGNSVNCHRRLATKQKITDILTGEASGRRNVSSRSAGLFKSLPHPDANAIRGPKMPGGLRLRV